MSESIQAKHTTLKQLINSLDWEVDRVTNKKVKSAHTKLRAQYMHASKMINALRAEVLAHQKSLTPKAKKKVTISVEEGDTEAEPVEQPEQEHETAAPPPSPKKKTRKGRKTKK